jgi:putative oxidoreductase
VDLALFVLRLVVGLGFSAHGAQKLFGAFGGHGLDGTAAFFEQAGLRPGNVNARVAGTAELLGGVLIALGLLTPVAGAALIGVMTAAVFTVHLPNGFFNTNNAATSATSVLVAAVFVLAGVGAATGRSTGPSTSTPPASAGRSPRSARVYSEALAPSSADASWGGRTPAADSRTPPDPNGDRTEAR